MTVHLASRNGAIFLYFAKVNLTTELPVVFVVGEACETRTRLSVTKGNTSVFIRARRRVSHRWTHLVGSKALPACMCRLVYGEIEVSKDCEPDFNAWVT